VLQEYFVAIDNLPTQFTDFKEAHHYITLQETPSPFIVHAKNGKKLFYLNTLSNEQNDGISLGVLIGFAGLILLLLLMQRAVAFVTAKTNVWKGLGALILGFYGEYLIYTIYAMLYYFSRLFLVLVSGAVH
jgi:hypothetical protein